MKRNGFQNFEYFIVIKLLLTLGCKVSVESWKEKDMAQREMREKKLWPTGLAGCVKSFLLSFNYFSIDVVSIKVVLQCVLTLIEIKLISVKTGLV